MTTDRTAPVLYLVIPCYNEEAVLPETTKRLTEKLHAMIRAGQIDRESRILYVDDGSRDQTWALISEYSAAIPYVDGVKLAHNRGHQNALLAGLMTAMPLCDCAISMDADLQDDIDAVDRFVEKYMEGCDVVYGVRNKRDKDTFFKRTTAEGYYKFLRLLGVDIVFNHADYRLMSRRALEGLSEYKEVNLFLRGIVPLIGFRSDYVYYDRGERDHLFQRVFRFAGKPLMPVVIDVVAAVSDQRDDAPQEKIDLAVFGKRVERPLAHQAVVRMVIDRLHPQDAHDFIKALGGCALEEGIGLALFSHAVDHIASLQEFLHKLVQHFDVVL